MFSWLKQILGLGRGPTGSQTSSYQSTWDDVRQQIERDVVGGFMGRDEIIETAVDAFESEGFENLRAEAREMTDKALAEHLKLQAAWPPVTDCDRLDQAFAALEAKGVISRQNFSCCGTCGSYEIGDEIETARTQNRPARGYAFYHMQDTERAAQNDGLYLNYGATEPTDEAAVAVGHEIVSELKAHGFEPEWDGTIERRIQLPLDWKRRRVCVAA